MKRQLTIFIAILLIVLQLTSCDTFVSNGDFESSTNTNSGNLDNSNSIQDITQNMLSVNSYETVLSPALEQVGEAVTDGYYNYFYFKLGEVKNVPVYYDHAYHHTGVTESEYKWEATSIHENIYSEVISNSISTATTAKIELNVKTEVSGSLKASYSGIGADIGVKASTNLSTSLGNTTSLTQKESFTNTINNTIKESQARTVRISKDSPNGFYRYIVYGDFDLYVALVCNISRETISYTYLSVLQDDSVFDTFEYSETNDFSVANLCETKLELTEEMLNSLSVNFFSRDITSYVEDYVFGSVEFSNTNRRRITDDGFYGLAQVSKADEIDLSSLSKYMTEAYTFWFDIKVNGECAEGAFGIGIIKGNHELHLYDRLNEATSREIDYEIAEKEYGWLGEIIWSQERGFYDADMFISGEKCKDFMYIYYDAHGEDEDTWYLNEIHIQIKVQSKK